MMDKENIYAIIPAGGKGRRTFGVSTDENPKQFCPSPPDGKSTFIQETVKRLSLIGVSPSHVIIIVTNDSQRELAKAQCLSQGIISPNIVTYDPDLGYAGCMIKASLAICETNPKAIVISSPADQYVAGDFLFPIEDAVSTANKENTAVIVGVQINDRNTVTGCGNVIFKEKSVGPCYKITDFIEKPNREKAEELIRQGNSVVNTGINVWPASLIKDRFDDKNYTGIETDEFMNMLDGKLKVAVGVFEWYDCGTLASLYSISRKSPNHKNVRLGNGNIECSNCRRSLFFATEGINLRVNGARDDAITARSDGERLVVTVVKLSHSQEVKNLANDFYDQDGVFTNDDFLYGTNNNNVLRSNIPEEDLEVGFLGVNNYAVIAYRELNGDITITVSQQRV